MAPPAAPIPAKLKGVAAGRRAAFREHCAGSRALESPAADRPHRTYLQVIRYLLDTNVVSELRKHKPHGAVVAWMNALRPEQIFLSALTIGELQAGVELTRRNDEAKAVEIENWLSMVESTFAALPMDSACFREWARLMSRKSPELIEDAMIAATARVHGLQVATRNEKDFRHFQVGTFNPFQWEE
jgi:predicted nucleic acid-binding protein